MFLKQHLNTDLKTAMKSADQLTVGVLRLVITALNNKAIEKRGAGKGDELTDDETMSVLMSEAKKRRESVEAFTQGGRADLAEKEQAELGVLQKYLPAQISEAELEAAVDKILSGMADRSNVGMVMKAVMQELKGKADGKVISEIVKKKLS